jgi:putative phosphoesterase
LVEAALGRDMLVILGDTHDETELMDPVSETLASASLVAHTGDFTTGGVLDSFEDIAPELVAVAGNRDSEAVRERLPEWRTFKYEGYRFLLTHGHRHDRTSLSLLARQEEADVVGVGHTHRAGIDHVGDVVVVNPGSHADPRGGEPTMAVVTRTGDGLRVRIRTIGGQIRESAEL